MASGLEAPMILGNTISIRLGLAVLASVILVSATLYPIFRMHGQDRADSVRDAGRTLLDAEQEALTQHINEGLNDALAMGEIPSLHSMLSDAQRPLSPYHAESFQQKKVRLEKLLNTWLTHFGHYTRLSLIDLNGLEQLAVGLIQRPAGAHGGYSYFQKAMTLKRRELYVSRPYVGPSIYGPEIRTLLLDLAVPVFGDDDRRLGVLLLTLDWRRLMGKLPHNIENGNSADVLLVDAQGVSLMPDTLTSTFGASLAKWWPEAWKAMEGNSRGEVFLGDQILLFRQHDIRSQHYRSQAALVSSDAQGQPWYLATVVHRPGAVDLLIENPAQLVAIGLVYLMAIGFSAFWVMSDHRQRSLRRQAEALSTETRQYARDLHDLYENAPCGYHSLDEDGRIVKMNRTELSWLGYNAEEVIGQRCYRDFVTPETRDAFDAAFDAVLGKVHEGSAECALTCRDGSTFPVAIEATAQTTGDGFQYSRAMVFDLTERKQLEDLLVRQSMTDPLTGLGNRRFLETQAEIEIARAKRSGCPICLIAIDLDHFKRINDTYGHDTGDQVLKAFAKTAQSQLRDGDVLCRIGGEEFIALLPETSQEQALGVAERLRFTVERQPVSVDEAGSLTYTASLGVTLVLPGESGLKKAIKRADKALYQAKEGGRNQVRLVFDTRS